MDTIFYPRLFVLDIMDPSTGKIWQMIRPSNSLLCRFYGKKAKEEDSRLIVSGVQISALSKLWNVVDVIAIHMSNRLFGVNRELRWTTVSDNVSPYDWRRDTCFSELWGEVIWAYCWYQTINLHLSFLVWSSSQTLGKID